MSLHLDERQRAMLKEMGITVWWPKPVVLVPEPAMRAAQPAGVKAARGNEINSFNEINVLKTINIDIENIAISTINTGTISQNNSYIHSKTSYSEIVMQVDQLIWPLLTQAAADCRACPLCEGRTKTVFGSQPPRPDISPGLQTPLPITLPTPLPITLPEAPQSTPQTTPPGAAPQVAVSEAPPQADWLIVGDLPGDAEDLAGEPFAGEAGQLLGNMLKAMGLSGASASCRGVYLTTVIKCRPPGNRNPTSDEVNRCAAYLHRQIECLQPKIILTLGKLAAQTLLQGAVPEVDKLPPGKLRGQVHAYQPQGANIPLVATYPPAYLLRNPQEKARVWEDLVLAMETLKAG